MAVPEWKTGDNYPYIFGTVLDANPSPVDISTASKLRFLAKSGNTLISGVAVNDDDGQVQNRGKWHYIWGSSDLATAGTYEVEIEVLWSTASQIETFPSDDGNNPTFQLSDDLDP